jgi:O-antigen/teichoic acid export membrane protein
MNIKRIIGKLKTQSLARDSAIVFAGSMVSNVGSYVYHLLMGRMLGPSGYGELSSLFSILYIFTVPLLVGQTVLVKFISGFKATGDHGQAKTLLYSVTQKALIVCFIGFPLIYMVSPWITGFLHLPSTTLFLLIYILFVISLLSIIVTSMLQGYQKFIWFSLLTSGVIIFKVILSVPFIRFGITGVLFAAIISAGIIYGLYSIPLSFIFKIKPKTMTLTKKEAFRFAVPTLFTLLGITSLYSTDIILVRHYFSPKEAGLYAALAILGKIIFYASSSVALVLFPVLSERSAKGIKSQKLILSAIGAVAAVSVILTGVYFLFPEFIIGMLFGKQYTGAGALLGLFGIFIAFFSVGNIILNACLGIGKTGIWIVPSVCAILQIITILLLHDSIHTILLINIGISLLLMIGSLGYYFVNVYEKV